MPACFSASNVRFTGAQQFSQKGRAKTALRFENQQPNRHHTAFQNRSVCNGQRRDSLLAFQSNSIGVGGGGGGGGGGLRRYSSALSRFRSGNICHSQNLTLNANELARLQKAAKIVSIDERLEALARREEIAKQLEEQAERSRNYYRKIDEERAKVAIESNSNKENADEDENEENSCANSVKKKTLDRAFIAKHEQEEEMKIVNRIILNAKCHAVRDAQVQEKHDIERQQRNEETRLEKLVMEEAVKALAKEDCNADKQKSRNVKYGNEIREQLAQREYLRSLEAERAEEEHRVHREIAAAVQRDEERQTRDAWSRRQKFRDELNRVVEMSNHFKKMMWEQERLAEMRVAAYMREKHDREKELARQKRLAKESFERQQQRLYNLAQKIADFKATREELSFIREQERVEREYRRQEKELALRKKQLELEIKEARDRQMEEVKLRQTLQIAREEKDFNILIDNLKKEESRLKKLEEERQTQRKSYREEIIRQIKDKALAKQRIIDDERREANLWREAENQRLANIRSVIGAKMSAMREACLPDRYIKDVEKQLNRFISNPNSKSQIN